MRTSLIVVCLAAAALMYPAAGVAQQVQTFTGDVVQVGSQPRQFKTGTGRIRGRVMSADTGAGLRRVQVRISGSDVPMKSTLTDGQGSFEFSELPAGRYALSASKPGYVNVQYGQTRPFESGRPIELADRQTLERIDIVMPRGSVIVGRIADEFGEPLADAMVMPYRQSWVGGRPRLAPAGRPAQTNDLGQYRIYGLPPGDYYVSASIRNAETLPIVEMAANAGVGASSPGSGYAPTFFPGTASPADAQKITVAAGQEASADFALLPVRLARITGLVVSSEGKPVENALVNAVPSRGLEAGPLMAGSGRTNKEGLFTLSSVAPGDYTLQVRSVTVTTTSNGDATTTVVTRVGGAAGDSESGSLPVSVTGEDLTNVVITTTRGATAIGRVTFEGGAKPPPKTIRVTTIPGELEGPAAGMGIADSMVKPDGSFELKGMTGVRLLRVGGLPQGWTLKSVELNGNDITDIGVDVKTPETLSGFEIVVTSKSTELVGTVTRFDGAPTKDYTLVVFAEDAQKWTLRATRWVTAARPDQEGRFRVRNLPAGSYYAIAVDYVPQGEWQNPDLLERLKAKAHRVSITEGQAQTLDLKLTDRY
jgi:uncharacterized protein (DUF2141 family)